MNIAPQPLIAPGAPPPPAVGAAAAAPQQAPIPVAPSTFAELYNTLTTDAHAGVYGPVLMLFTAEPAVARRTPAEIRTALNNAGDGFLQAYLLLGANNCTVMIHTVSRYPSLPGVASPWDGQHFGFIGEVEGPMAQPVEFPGATAFDLTPAAVPVPTINMMEARWIAVGAVPYLPPYGMADADTELIRMRRAALLPFVAVPRCLTLLSMRELWTVLGQPLIDGSREVEMGILLDWI